MHQDQRVGRAVTRRLSLSDTEGCQPGRGELTGISYLWPVLSPAPALQTFHTHYQRHRSSHFLFLTSCYLKKNKTGITKGSNYNKTLHICSDSNSPCQQSPLSLCVMKFIRSKRNTKSHLGSQQPCHYVRGWSQEWVWWTLVNPESIMERGHIATHSNPEYSCLKQQHRQPDFTEAQTKWGPLSWDGRGIQK